MGKVKELFPRSVNYQVVIGDFVTREEVVLFESPDFDKAIKVGNSACLKLSGNNPDSELYVAIKYPNSNKGRKIQSHQKI